MSQTITQTQQIELVNIISISEFKLSKNFEILLKQLRQANERIDALDRKIDKNETSANNAFQIIRQHGHQVQAKIIDLHTEIGSVSNNLIALSTDVAVKNGEHNMKIVDMELINKQLNTKIQAVDKGLSVSIQGLSNQQMKIQDLMKTNNNKQGLNMQKISKQVQMLVMKYEQNLKKQKVVQQRISTLEKQMSGQETVRLQDIIIQKIMKQVRKSPIAVSHRDIVKSKINLTKKQVKMDIIQGQQGFTSQQQHQQKIKSSKHVQFQKLISIKNLQLKENSQLETNEINYINAEDLIDLSDIRQSIETLKKNMKMLELSSDSQLNNILNKIKKDVNQLKNSNQETIKDVSKLKTDSSATNLTQKLQQLRPELNKLWGVVAGTEDKNLFLQRKLDEMKKVLETVTIYVRENNMSRYDEKIRMIQSDLFNQIKQILEKLELKTTNSDFIKHVYQTEESFRQIRSILSNKCQKSEVKKALLFIQSKIKQIILVISEDEQYQKDALLTKKQIKCVSCDKQLDKQAGLVNTEPRNWNMMPQKDMHPESYGKCGISRFGSLATKIRKLQGSQLPILKSKVKDKQNKVKQDPTIS